MKINTMTTNQALTEHGRPARVCFDNHGRDARAPLHYPHRLPLPRANPKPHHMQWFIDPNRPQYEKDEEGE